MTPLILYLIKVNLALTLFYLAYRYGLRKLTFYTLNRFYLLFAVLFSSVYPLIRIRAIFPSRDDPGGQLIQYLPDLGALTREDPLEIGNVLTVVFWSGVIVMAIRFLLQCISLVRIHFSSRKQRIAGQDLRIVTEKINPFSFFRNIYLNPLLHSQEEQQSIIAHERVHVKQWHTADILAGELNRIFYWFNPGAWLMMQAIKENLEFITDRKVLRSGMDAKSYQYSLVRASHIPHVSAIANNFNFSHLKIRITMMDKKTSNELHLVKYLVLVPFITVLALAFNVSKASLSPTGASGQAASFALKEAVFSADTIPANTTTSSFDVVMDKNGSDSLLPPTEVKRVIRVEASDTVPEPVIEKVIIVADDSTKNSKPGPIILLDGAPLNDVEAINSANIASISVLKGKQATSLFGKSAEGGAVLITSKGNAVLDGTASEETIPGMDRLLDEQVLTLINGVEVSAEEVKVLAPGKIESIHVLKDKHATDKYGKKGEHGVIEILTKED